MSCILFFDRENKTAVDRVLGAGPHEVEQMGGLTIPKQQVWLFEALSVAAKIRRVWVARNRWFSNHSIR